MRNISYVSTFTISLGLLIFFTFFQSSFSLITKSPFSESGTKIENISSRTSNGKYFVNLQYSPESVRKGELSFFTVNLFNNSGDKQIRIRHVDCDFIILRNEFELFKISPHMLPNLNMQNYFSISIKVK